MNSSSTDTEHPQTPPSVDPIVEGTVGEFWSRVGHEGGLARWLSKVNRDSEVEATAGVRIRHKGRPPLHSLWSADPMARRGARRNWRYFLVGRGFFRFVHHYLFKLGFLHGPAGFHRCMIMAMYDYWVELKMSELESRWRAATDRKVAQLLSERQG
jgi:hypothetical protein